RQHHRRDRQGLRDWLGVDRRTFYDPTRFAIIPMGFCFPGTGKGGDMPPRTECAPLWRLKLLQLLPDIELTILLGQYAHEWHIEGVRGTSLSERAARWREHWPNLLPLPHPSPRNMAWFKRHPWFEHEVLPA
ncbi:MAG TPA: uracil-DNA glycosylase family protein, partial [Rhabdaerophilum sp.]|nr:uracil-DNA glycosylase family protein [Rhabdaerophilum sp.]